MRQGLLRQRCCGSCSPTSVGGLRSPCFLLGHESSSSLFARPRSTASTASASQASRACCSWPQCLVWQKHRGSKAQRGLSSLFRYHSHGIGKSFANSKEPKPQQEATRRCKAAGLQHALCGQKPLRALSARVFSSSLSPATTLLSHENLLSRPLASLSHHTAQPNPHSLSLSLFLS